jgi:S-(hydroxymethyl)glutathione dehydrogenase / alcohol dehydrogenase
MKTRAAVAWEANKPLTIETIDLDGPKPGEVLVEIMATGVCHTDAYTLSGSTPKGCSPPSSAMKVRASCARSAPA